MAVSDQAVATGKQLDQLVYQHHSHAFDRCGAKGELRPSRSAHGACARGLLPVAAISCATIPPTRIWPNRDRFVLSNGHASMLLYSLLHLAGVREVNAKGEDSVDARRLARRHQELPPDRQQDSRPSRIWPDHRRRNHYRAARPGSRQQRRHGDCRALARRSFQSSRLRAFQLQHLGYLRRRRHDGRHLLGGRVGRRPSAAFQSLLDLRQQPHHHRRQDRPRLQRRCRRAL